MTNTEFNEKFRDRTRILAVRTIKFLSHMPYNQATRTLCHQLCKSATSVGANFRAFCRGRSKNEKFAKICIVVEEADEIMYWLDLFDAAGYGDKHEISWLANESLEILKVTSKIKSSLSP